MPGIIFLQTPRNPRIPCDKFPGNQKKHSELIHTSIEIPKNCLKKTVENLITQKCEKISKIEKIAMI